MASLEEKRNLKSATTMVALSVGIMILLFFIGIPLIGRFTSFLSNIRSSGVSTNDKTPPAPPRFNQIPDYTNQKNMDITGKSEAGATVELTFNGNKKENTANKSGDFVFNVDLKEGTNTYFALARDNSDNVSQKTEEREITFDNQAPKLELNKPSDGSNLFGSAQRQITIEGTTETNAQVTVNERFVTVEESGNFQYSTTLSEGENKFTLKSVDAAGNLTEKPLTINFTP